MNRVSPPASEAQTTRIQTTKFAKGTANMLARTAPRTLARVQRKLRAGFTLIEILVVIIIISLLLALLVPAVGSARKKVNEARVITEIKALESAVTTFKGMHGMEPPSKMVIFTNAADWNTVGAAPYKAIIRRMWPQFDFTMPAGSYPAAWAGMPGGQAQFKAGECLLFFVGGIIDPASGNLAPQGFAKDPAHPFAPMNTGMAIKNRETPAFSELDVGRIKDSDGNGLYEYVDSLPSQTNPYLYFSSYEGKGYRVTTVNNDLPLDGSGNYSLLQDVYRVANTSSASPAPPGTTPAATPQGSQTLPPQKAQSFQIISPGYDGQYGLGGAFDPNQPNGALSNVADYDNLTNFHGGRLFAQ